MVRRLSPCHRLDGSKKVRYRSKGFAVEEANRLASVHQEPRYGAYECKGCHYFHVGRRGGKHMIPLRDKWRMYESELNLELGPRALTHLWLGDGTALQQRFRAAQRKAMT